ncbi:MAG: hypothetical protein ACREDA_12060 [Methylocella sp.]
MFSSAPLRLRSALLVFGIGLGLSGLWLLLPELPRPKGLAFDRNATPQNQPIFESLVADVDAAVARLLRSGQPR